MTKSERLFRILGLTADEWVLEADKPMQRRRSWRKPLAACLAAMCAVGWLALGGLHFGAVLGVASGSSAVTGSGASGGEAGADFMSYAGPVLPLTALTGSEGLTAERTVVWDFAPGTYDDGSPRQWGAHVRDGYILSNSAEEDITAELLYPFAGSFHELGSQRTAVTADGQAVEAALYAGPYSGGFQSASFDGGDTLNLQYPERWEQYQALLAGGRYQTQALTDRPALDIPVTVYRFSDFAAPHERYRAATQAIAFTISENATQILTYGFNGMEQNVETGFRRYSYFVPDGITRETERKLLIVLGEDLSDYTLQGYRDGGCDAGEEIGGVSCTVTREISTLEAALDEVCRDYLAFYDRGTEEMTGFTPAMHLDAAAELLWQYGLLSDDPRDRYDTGRLDDIALEALYLKRVLYLRFTVTIPAGGSAEVAASLWKEPSHDFFCGGSGKEMLQGYDLMTRTGSVLSFTGQAAVLEHTEGIELVRQDFGFDLENSVIPAALDLGQEHYSLEIREKK